MNGYMRNVLNYLYAKNGVLRGSFTLNSDYINIDEFMSKMDSNQNITSDSSTENSKTQTGVIVVPPNLELQLQAYARKVNFKELLLNNAQGWLQIKSGKLSMK